MAQVQHIRVLCLVIALFWWDRQVLPYSSAVSIPITRNAQAHLVRDEMPLHTQMVTRASPSNTKSQLLGDLSQSSTDFVALTKRVLVENIFDNDCGDPGPHQTTCNCYIALWERRSANDLSPDWWSRNVFLGQFTVPIVTHYSFGGDASLNYTSATQLRGEVQTLFTMKHVRRTDAGLESHSFTITFMRDEVCIAIMLAEVLSPDVIEQQVYHGHGDWTVTPIWPEIGTLNISVPANLLLKTPPVAFPHNQFSGLMASKLAKRFQVLNINATEVDPFGWDAFVANPQGVFDFEQLGLLQGKSDFELQLNQDTVRCIFATSGKVIARFEAPRDVGSLDKVAMGIIAGDGVWSDEPSYKLLQRAKM